METPIQEIYSQYEKYRSCKTKEEHADKFLAWFLTYKEQNLEKEKEVIIEAFEFGNGQLCKSSGEHYFEENFKLK